MFDYLNRNYYLAGPTDNIWSHVRGDIQNFLLLTAKNNTRNDAYVPR